nr:MAG TPA: hypothetical protein [Crassvirales sp.]
MHHSKGKGALLPFLIVSSINIINIISDNIIERICFLF